METDIRSNLGAARFVDAIYFLAGIIAILIAARFVPVAIEKGANILAKITITIFGKCRNANSDLSVAKVFNNYVNHPIFFVMAIHSL